MFTPIPGTMTPRALFHPARLARRPVLSTQSDERLVDLVRAGSGVGLRDDRGALPPALMRYVSRLLPPERAEDVVQQAFVKAYEAMHRDGAELNLGPWLYRIAHNTALNALRDRSLRHGELDERIDGVERPDQALERTPGAARPAGRGPGAPGAPARRHPAARARGPQLRGDRARPRRDRRRRAPAPEPGTQLAALRGAAVTPMPLLTRLASGDSTEPVAARVAEMVGGAAQRRADGEGLRATALVTGAVVGGVAPWWDGAAMSGGARGGGADRAPGGGRSAGGLGAAARRLSRSGRRRQAATTRRAAPSAASSDGEEHATVRTTTPAAGPRPRRRRRQRRGPGGGDDAPADDDHAAPAAACAASPSPSSTSHSGPGRRGRRARAG